MLLALALFGCKKEPEPLTPKKPAPVVPGAPVVGAAEGWLKLPVGTPLSGFTGRCSCLGSDSFQDKRESAYNVAFMESTGVQTYPSIKVVWLENGDDHLVWIKTDSIYSFDGLVVGFTEALEAETGLDLAGRVVHSTNHSHSSFGAFTKQQTFFLGSDRYNEEVFQRYVEAVVDVAVQAHDSREPAKIGMGWAKDWDPEDKVYSDRRPENDGLVLYDDQETPGWGKDPHLALMRFDTLDDEPIAVLLNFGMHGTSLGGGNPLVSGDSGGNLEHVLQEYFPAGTVVMHTQGAGGDVSPRGSDGGFAKLETLGEHALDPVVELWENTPTSADDIRLETASRHINQHPSDIHVTRGGTVDWYYKPYDEFYEADNEIYDSNGALIGEIDEFNTEYGAAFCGSGDLALPVGALNVDVFPYSNCLEVELLTRLILVFFELAEEDIVLPLPESLKAGTAASRLGPLQTRLPSGKTVSQDLLVGFFPGESTTTYVEQWRRRAEAELGYEMALHVGYSMDHEGYLMLAEDWLLGGYEPDITIWGPLQAEHIMEGVLTYALDVLGTDVHELLDPALDMGPTEYADWDLPTLQPDTTPDAGRRIDSEPEYFWIPEGFTPNLVTPAEVPRVQGMVQLAWKGGDPGVDNPNVVLERKKGSKWEAVTSATGRPVDEATFDILLAHTPDPLYPVEAEQTHYWWAVWQAVGHVHDRAGLPEGTYRLAVYGERYTGGDATWPWTTETYELASDPFEVVAGALTASIEADALWVSLHGPADGYRLVAMDGNYRGHNPVEGPITLTIDGSDSDVDVVEVSGGRARLDLDATTLAAGVDVVVTDTYGNTVTITP